MSDRRLKLTEQNIHLKPRNDKQYFNYNFLSICVKLTLIIPVITVLIYTEY